MSGEERQADQEDQDQADRQDQADIQDQADLVDDDQHGVRGRRGVQGLRGRPGADSDSIEVLTDVLNTLTDELKKLSEYVYAERRGRRLSMAVIAVAFILTVAVGAGGYTNYRTLSDRRASDQQQQAMTSRVSDYDQQIQLNDSCMRGNDARVQIKSLFYDLFDLVAARPRDTPAEQLAAQDFVDQSKAKVAERLPSVDCATEAPAPKGDRPS